MESGGFDPDNLGREKPHCGDWRLSLVSVSVGIMGRAIIYISGSLNTEVTNQFYSGRIFRQASKILNRGRKFISSFTI